MTLKKMSLDFALSNFRMEGGIMSNISGDNININKSNKGYLYVNLNGFSVELHRLVFMLYKKYVPIEVDHIDRNKLNNDIKNLRECTRGENNRNIGITKANTSGFKGVTMHSRGGKWIAQIRKDGKLKYIGLFKSKVDAAKAYDNECLDLHGEFAITNKSMMLY